MKAADALTIQKRSWCLYDWATNGYQVTIASALFPVYFVEAVVSGPVQLWGFSLPPSALWGFALSFAALASFLASPVLGAIADYTFWKRRFLIGFAAVGALFACLMVFITPGAVGLGVGLFVIAQFCYISGNVFYNAFLPGLAGNAEMDALSSRGFAYGYMGGALQFALSLALVSGHQWLGISHDLAIRLALLSAGLWWAVFGWLALRRLRETRPPGGSATVQSFSHPVEAVSYGTRHAWKTLRALPAQKPLLLFFIAFVLYNDGVQTVIGVSAAYASDELSLPASTIMFTFLLVQFVAFAGAFLFSFASRRMGTRNALLLSLVIWCGVVIYAYFLPENDPKGFFILGIVVGLVLGGNQALSRSLFTKMIPEQAAAEYFGFFTIFHKLSAIAGPFLFGLFATWFGSARPAILVLLVFFLLGGFLLSRLPNKATSIEH